MARTPAADAVPPPADPATPTVPVSSVTWLYNGPPGRTYTNVPVTVDPGDVVAWPDPPANDGAWTPTDVPATRLPDNHRPDPDHRAALEG